MSDVTVAEALEREHRQIDGGIETFVERSASGDSDPLPLQGAIGGLRRHIYLEELFLFPPLREAGMVMPIFVMQREHRELWATMDAVDALLADGADPKAVRETCATLLSQLDAHNSKEEPVIYTQADRVLAGEASDELRSFLDAGALPEGWAPDRA